MPMVGVDPALVLCYRDEYNQVLGDKRGDFRVMLVHEWLPQALPEAREQENGGEAWYLFGHCTEVTALPAAPKQWAEILRASARNWKTSAWAVVGWPAPTVMR